MLFVLSPRYPLRVFLPFLLLVNGCIYIPVPLTPSMSHGPILPHLLGDKDSGRKLHVGVSKAEVLRVLGKPLEQSSDGKQLGYSFGYLRGYWAGLIIRISDGTDDTFDEPRYRVYTALLLFDSEDKLSSFEIVHNDQCGGVPDTMAIREMMGKIAIENQVKDVVPNPQ